MDRVGSPCSGDRGSEDGARIGRIHDFHLSFRHFGGDSLADAFVGETGYADVDTKFLGFLF